MCDLDHALPRAGAPVAPLVRGDGYVDGWFGVHLQDSVDNLYLNAGWNYGGFKASPASGWYFADLIANDRPDPVIANLDLERFRRGVNIDERGAGPDPKLHG